MNERSIVAAIQGAILLSCISTIAFAQVPSISGTFYNDLNSNSVLDTSEEMAGVALVLYADDGDGMFDASLDAIAGNMTTDVDGSYYFGGLASGTNYFVHQQAQTVGNVQLDECLTPALDPITMTLMIDAFDDQQVVQGDPINAVNGSNLTTNNAVLGGQRDMLVEYISGPAEAVLHAHPYGFNEVLEFDLSAGVLARAVVTWDGVDNDMSDTPALNGLGGLDWSDSEAFMFDLGIDAAGSGESLTMRIFSGTDVSTATVLIPVTNGTATETQIVPFSEFSGAASFSSVDAFQIELGGNAPSIDAQIGPIELISGTSTNVAVKVVPEPSAVCAGATGLVFLLFLRRRRSC